MKSTDNKRRPPSSNSENLQRPNKIEYTNGSAHNSSKADDYDLICRQQRKPNIISKKGHDTRFNSDLSTGPGFLAGGVNYFENEEIDCYTENINIQLEEPFFAGLSWTHA